MIINKKLLMIWAVLISLFYYTKRVKQYGNSKKKEKTKTESKRWSCPVISNSHVNVQDTSIYIQTQFSFDEYLCKIIYSCQ